MRRRGFTLIELLVTIVVISVAAVALLSVFGNLVRGSADPVIQQQATTIAEAYLDEILGRAFADPQGGETGGEEAGETRSTYDDVQDYNDADNVVRDQNGTAIAALSAYSVAVTVTGDMLDTIAASDAMRIDVSVSHAATGTITLSGYRTNY